MAKQIIIRCLYFGVFALPFVFAMRDVFSLSTPFWYDPARDLLLAQENLQHIRLIGSTTGIPGVFYGPYWLWTLSLALVLTYHPSLITFLTLTLPYMLLLPLVLIRLRKKIPNFPVIGVWLLFILGFSQYATQLWNPHPAPLLTFLFTYLAISLSFRDFSKRNIATIVCTGFVAGLLANFHLSFGIGLMVAGSVFATTLFLLQNRIYLRQVKLLFKSAALLLNFFIGMVAAFSPFILFEVRNDFLQSRALLHAFTNSFFYNSAVVGQVGMDQVTILNHFLSLPVKLLQLPPTHSWIVITAITTMFLLTILSTRKRLHFDYGLKLITFSLLTILIVGYIYLSSKNPVWDYHFIALESIVLLLIGGLASRSRLSSISLSFFAGILLLLSLFRFPETLRQNVLILPTLGAKIAIVEHVYNEAGNTPFSLAAYSPSLYTFDYDYLLRWKQKQYSTSSFKEGPQSTIFLIIPPTTKSVRDDFINYKTPEVEYTTKKSTTFPDGTEVIKRQALETPTSQ